MASLLGKIIADFRTSLAAKISIADVAATLQSATDDDGVALPTGRYFLTIDGDNSQKEHFSCTLTGTALTNLKSVSRQGVETVGAVREHRVGATVTITDFAHIKKINDLMDGTTGWDATNPLKYDADPIITDNKHIATKKYVDGVVVAGAPDASAVTKGVTKLSVAPVSPTAPIAVGDNDSRVPTAAQVGYIPTVDEKASLAGNSGTPPSASNKLIDAADVSNAGISGKIVRLNATAYPAGDGSALTNLKVKFGGTGADGALTISSGVTTIDLAGAQIVVKNYTSISITGTGKLAFSNPHANGTIIILKSQGNVTLTSSTVPCIDASGMGAAPGNNPTGILDETNHFGGNGAGSAGASGPIFDAISRLLATTLVLRLSRKAIYLMCGASGGNSTGGAGMLGGGGGGSIWGSGGAGGIGGGLAAGGGGCASYGSPSSDSIGARGGGALLIECGGDINFTGSIYARGANGVSDGNYGPGSGGGGGGMTVIIYSGAAVAVSGTIDNKGGNGGSNAYYGGASGGASQGGVVTKNTEFA